MINESVFASSSQWFAKFTTHFVYYWPVGDYLETVGFLRFCYLFSYWLDYLFELDLTCFLFPLCLLFYFCFCFSQYSTLIPSVTHWMSRFIWTLINPLCQAISSCCPPRYLHWNSINIEWRHYFLSSVQYL